MDSGDNRWIRRLCNGLLRSNAIAKDFMMKVTLLTCDECTEHIFEIADKFKEIRKAIEEVEMEEKVKKSLPVYMLSWMTAKANMWISDNH